MLDQVIEGYVLLHRDTLWMVKGCEHPINGFIAYPRYFKDGSKVKDPIHGLDIARRLGLVKYIDGLKMEVPVIPRYAIDSILDPFNRSLWPSLPNIINEFLNEIGALNSEDVGLTGSYLVSSLVSIKPRDLDLIIRDVREGLRIYDVLKDLREDGITEHHIESKDFSGTDPITRNELLRRRVLEGVYRDKLVYSIRVVSCKQNTEIRPISYISYYTGKVRITQALSPIIMPYIYEALGSGGAVLIKSQRMRFSEIPVNTELFLSSCRVERYVSGETYLSLDNPECKVSIVDINY
ncbi:hypothetical protein [Vulcanisaeta sp. JCM 14467]